MNTTKRLIKRAVEVREAARAVRDFSRSNQINRLLWLVREAKDSSAETIARLEMAVQG